MGKICKHGSVKMSKLKLNKVAIAPCGDKVRRNNSSKTKRGGGRKFYKDSQCQLETFQLFSLSSFYNHKNNKNGQQQKTKFFENWKYENIQSDN